MSSSMPSPQDPPRSPFASRPDVGTVGSVLDGRYRIEQSIGEGGMGVIVRALDLRLDRVVAVKLLHSEYADQEDVLERFAREAMVIAKLRSQHVVSVLDVSTDRDNPYLVLEYLEGESLEDRIYQQGPLPLLEAVRYVRQITEALEEAHAAGILHRDIKPANVFLARQPNHEIIAKLLDFGTARFHDAKRAGQLSKPTITKQYETFGSPAYMPPEQISSARNTDERSDVWALGTVLYEAVTGKIAFEGEYPEVFVVISTREPVPLRTLRPDAPPELETIATRCLRKVKDERYASVTELKRALASLEQEILPSRARANVTMPSSPRPNEIAPATPVAWSEPGARPQRLDDSDTQEEQLYDSVPTERRRGAWVLALVALLVVLLGFGLRQVLTPAPKVSATPAPVEAHRDDIPPPDSVQDTPIPEPIPAAPTPVQDTPIFAPSTKPVPGKPASNAKVSAAQPNTSANTAPTQPTPPSTPAMPAQPRANDGGIGRRY